MQITRLVGLMVMVVAGAISGCAGLKFYDNPKLIGPETGVKCYYAKPYLLVTSTSTTSSDQSTVGGKKSSSKDDGTKTAGTDGGTKTSSNKADVSVIYLPDLTNPVYARMKSGYGTADLSLSLEGGMLKSVGQKTDTKIPETITALGSIVKGLAAPKAAAPGAAPGAPQAEKPKFRLYEINLVDGKMVFNKVLEGDIP